MLRIDSDHALRADRQRVLIRLRGRAGDVLQIGDVPAPAGWILAADLPAAQEQRLHFARIGALDKMAVPLQGTAGRVEHIADGKARHLKALLERARPEDVDEATLRKVDKKTANFVRLTEKP